MTTAVTEQVLLEGAWHALAQAGRLLNSATYLLNAGDPSTALAVAMFGREELGRSRLLRNLARDVMKGTTLTARAVNKQCDDHVAKQSASDFSTVLKPPLDSELGKAVLRMSAQEPSSREWQDAHALLEAATAAKQKRQSQERHDRRCHALYVDLKDSGAEWNRPMDIREDDAREDIREALNDYRLERERLTKPEFAIAIPEHVAVKEMAEARARMAIPVDLPTVPLWL